MATLLGALESMKAKLDEDEDVKSGDTEIEAAMIAAMEAEQEVEASNTEIMALDDVVEEAEEAIERLEGIRDAILEYGISKSMMKAADPRGELCAAGIVASYEELEDTPVKDENAEAAIEGIGGKISDMWNKLKELVKASWGKLRSWVDSVIRGFSSYGTLLTKMYHKVKAVKIDDAEFGKIKANVVTKAEFKKIEDAIGILKEVNFEATSRTLAKLKDGLNNQSFDKAKLAAVIAEGRKTLLKEFNTYGITAATGIGFNKAGKIERKAPQITSKQQTMRGAGWGLKEILDAIHHAGDLLKSLAAEKRLLLDYVNEYDSLIKLIAHQLTKIKGMTSEEGRRQNAVFNGMVVAAADGRKLLQAGTYAANTLAKMALTLGRTALKAEKK